MKVVGVQFKYNAKMSYYSPKEGEAYFVGQNVVVEHNKETVVATLKVIDKDIEERELDTPLKEVVRIATAEDLKKVEQGKKKAEEGLEIAREKIIEMKLPMKILVCEI